MFAFQGMRPVTLGLDRILVIHAGDRRFSLAEGIEVIGAAEALHDGIAAA